MPFIEGAPYTLKGLILGENTVFKYSVVKGKQLWAPQWAIGTGLLFIKMNLGGFSTWQPPSIQRGLGPRGELPRKYLKLEADLKTGSRNSLSLTRLLDVSRKDKRDSDRKVWNWFRSHILLEILNMLTRDAETTSLKSCSVSVSLWVSKLKYTLAYCQELKDRPR